MSIFWSIDGFLERRFGYVFMVIGIARSLTKNSYAFLDDYLFLHASCTLIRFETFLSPLCEDTMILAERCIECFSRPDLRTIPFVWRILGAGGRGMGEGKQGKGSLLLLRLFLVSGSRSTGGCYCCTVCSSLRAKNLCQILYGRSLSSRACCHDFNVPPRYSSHS